MTRESAEEVGRMFGLCMRGTGVGYSLLKARKKRGDGCWLLMRGSLASKSRDEMVLTVMVQEQAKGFWTVPSQSCHLTPDDTGLPELGCRKSHF